MRHEFCINIWPKVPWFFHEFFQSCKWCKIKDSWTKDCLVGDIEFKHRLRLMSLFSFIFYSHSLLDQKINNVLSISNDQAILKAIQSIIQNMLATEDPSQQQLHFLQSCGFGGLWRFAGPFTKTSVRFFYRMFNDITNESSWLWCVWLSKMLFISVQFDGWIIGIVCKLSGSNGRNVSAHRRRNRNHCITSSTQFEL